MDDIGFFLEFKIRGEVYEEKWNSGLSENEVRAKVKELKSEGLF